jgi:hypothetical protein
MMKKVFALGILASAIAATTAVNAAPSAKFAAQLSNTQLVSEQTCATFDSSLGQNCGYSATILRQALKTANQKDLLIGVSLETLLANATSVSSKNGNKDSSSSDAQIAITVYVDGMPAEPGTVTYGRRTQELSATLGGVLESCTDGGDGSLPDGTIVIEEECVVTPEEIELMQRSMSANHFNFVAPDVSSGEHRIEVHAAIDLGAEAGNGAASASALIGKGSLVVEEVRATNTDDGIAIIE